MVVLYYINSRIITNTAEWFIADGDFNAKHTQWHRCVPNTVDQILFKQVFPIFLRHRPDVLDIPLIRTPLLNRQTNLDHLSSDHKPLLLEFSSFSIKSSLLLFDKNLNWKKFTTLFVSESLYQPTHLHHIGHIPYYNVILCEYKIVSWSKFIST